MMDGLQDDSQEGARNEVAHRWPCGKAAAAGRDARDHMGLCYSGFDGRRPASLAEVLDSRQALVLDRLARTYYQLDKRHLCRSMGPARRLTYVYAHRRPMRQETRTEDSLEMERRLQNCRIDLMGQR